MRRRLKLIQQWASNLEETGERFKEPEEKASMDTSVVRREMRMMREEEEKAKIKAQNEEKNSKTIARNLLALEAQRLNDEHKNYTAVWEAMKSKYPELHLKYDRVYSWCKGNYNPDCGGSGRPSNISTPALVQMATQMTKLNEQNIHVTPAKFRMMYVSLMKSEATSRGMEVEVCENSGKRMARKRANDQLAAGGFDFHMSSVKPDAKEAHRDVAARWSVGYAHFMTFKAPFNKYHGAGVKVDHIEAYRLFYFDETSVGGEHEVAENARFITTGAKPTSKTTKSSRHFTYGAFINAAGKRVASVLAFSGAATIIPAEGDFDPTQSLLINTKKGALTGNVDGKDGALMAAAKHFVKCLDQAYPKETRGHVFLMLDNGSSHKCPHVRGFLGENNVNIIDAHPNTTSWLQVSDQCPHATLKRNLKALYTNFPQIAKRPQLNLARIDEVCCNAFNFTTIVNAVKLVGFEYADVDHKMLVVRDEHVVDFCDGLVAKGVIRDDRDKTVAKRARLEESAALKVLKDAGVLKKSVPGFVSDEAIAITQKLFGEPAAHDDVDQNATKALSADALAKAGYESGTKVWESEELVKQARQIQREEKERKLAATRRSQEQEEIKKQKAVDAQDRQNRMVALKQKYANVNEAKWEAMKKGLGSYYKGKKDLEWAVAYVGKKL